MTVVAHRCDCSCWRGMTVVVGRCDCSCWPGVTVVVRRVCARCVCSCRRVRADVCARGASVSSTCAPRWRVQGPAGIGSVGRRGRGVTAVGRGQQSHLANNYSHTTQQLRSHRASNPGCGQRLRRGQTRQTRVCVLRTQCWKNTRIYLCTIPTLHTPTVHQNLSVRATCTLQRMEAERTCPAEKPFAQRPAAHCWTTSALEAVSLSVFTRRDSTRTSRDSVSTWQASIVRIDARSMHASARWHQKLVRHRKQGTLAQHIGKGISDRLQD